MPPKTSLARIFPNEIKVDKRVLENKIVAKFHRKSRYIWVSARATAMLEKYPLENFDVVIKDKREEVIDLKKTVK